MDLGNLQKLNSLNYHDAIVYDMAWFREREVGKEEHHDYESNRVLETARK